MGWCGLRREKKMKNEQSLRDQSYAISTLTCSNGIPRVKEREARTGRMFGEIMSEYLKKDMNLICKKLNKLQVV